MRHHSCTVASAFTGCHLIRQKANGVNKANVGTYQCSADKSAHPHFERCSCWLLGHRSHGNPVLLTGASSQVLKVAVLAEKYAVDYTWYVDTILNLIRVAGDQVSEEVWYRVIQIVINRDDVQGYAAKTVFEVSGGVPQDLGDIFEISWGS